jgi:hypothetical protein
MVIVDAIFRWIYKVSLPHMTKLSHMGVAFYCHPEDANSVAAAFEWLSANYPRGIRTAVRVGINVVRTKNASCYDPDLRMIFICVRPEREVADIGMDLSICAWHALCRQRGLTKDSLYKSTAREEMRFFLSQSRRLGHTKEQRNEHLLSLCAWQAENHFRPTPSGH